jgi:hypothetical protein
MPTSVTSSKSSPDSAAVKQRWNKHYINTWWTLIVRMIRCYRSR